MGQVEIVIGTADDGRDIPVRPGDTLTVRLDEVPTSGYRWEVDDRDPVVLETAGEDYTPPPGAALGGAGTREFRFRVVGSGKCRLTLNRRRAWDPASTVETVQVTLDATAAEP